MRYNLVVIGGGELGREAATAAARLNQRVALIEQRPSLEDAEDLPTGLVLSKAVYDAAVQLTGGADDDGLCGRFDRGTQPVELADIRRTVVESARREREAFDNRPERSRIDVFAGQARFLGPHEIEIQQPEGPAVVSADSILIATGTKPVHAARFSVDNRQVVDADEFLNRERLPESMIVIGGGEIGLNYAAVLARLGVQVTVVDGRHRLLESYDPNCADRLVNRARRLGVVFRLGEDAIAIDRLHDGLTAVRLESGERLFAEGVLLTTGRVGDTESLNLEAAGLEADESRRLWCNERQQTWTPHIYATGDAAGFPPGEGDLMEQVRNAVSHACGRSVEAASEAAVSGEVEAVLVGV